MSIEWNGHAIVVNHVYPPIPTREMDYCASLDGLEPPTGHVLDEGLEPWFPQGSGPTAALAMEDLLQELLDDAR